MASNLEATKRFSDSQWNSVGVTLFMDLQPCPSKGRNVIQVTMRMMDKVFRRSNFRYNISVVWMLVVI